MNQFSLDELIAVTRAFVANHYDDSPDVIKITMKSGKELSLPIPSRSPVPVNKPQEDLEEEWEPFIPTPFQRGILKALDGKALRTDALAAVVGDRSRLFRRGGLNELRDRGMVANHPAIGFYRPDAPPPELETTLS